MALDIYVGGFARYFSREWENVVEKWARESGTEYRQISPGDDQEKPTWEEVAGAVADWRQSINEGLGEALEDPLYWDESRDASYMTDRPGYEGYGALLVWAAHAQLGTPPPEQLAAEWYEDDAVLACAEPAPKQPYRPIILGNLWLPGVFVFSFDYMDLTGGQAHICSNHSLLTSLYALNEATFQFSDAEIAEQAKGDLGDAPTLREWAGFGFGVLHGLCSASVRLQLPIIIDA